jgi:hypothetical protein
MWALSGICAMGAIISLAGCEAQPKQQDPSGDTFAAETDARIHRGIADHQAMLGAQADPTLYRCHFDGNNLNALGKAKLDAILAGAPAKIYVDSRRESADAQRAAVSSYLSAAKVPDGSIALETGFAPDSSSFAAPALSRMSKTENPRSTSSSGSTSANNTSSDSAGDHGFGSSSSGTSSMPAR